MVLPPILSPLPNYIPHTMIGPMRLTDFAGTLGGSFEKAVEEEEEVPEITIREIYLVDDNHEFTDTVGSRIRVVLEFSKTRVHNTDKYGLVCWVTDIETVERSGRSALKTRRNMDQMISSLQ